MELRKKFEKVFKKDLTNERDGDIISIRCPAKTG